MKWIAVSCLLCVLAIWGREFFITQAPLVNHRLLGDWQSHPRDHGLGWFELRSDGTFRTWNTELRLHPWQGSIRSSTWSVRGDELVLMQQASPWPEARHKLKTKLQWGWPNLWESLQPRGRHYFEHVTMRYRVRSVTESELRPVEIRDAAPREDSSIREITFARMDSHETRP